VRSTWLSAQPDSFDTAIIRIGKFKLTVKMNEAKELIALLKQKTTKWEKQDGITTYKNLKKFAIFYKCSPYGDIEIKKINLEK
jgi:hypothetical protein